MYGKVRESGDYYQALGIISEYVETELTLHGTRIRAGRKQRRGNAGDLSIKDANAGKIPDG